LVLLANGAVLVRLTAVLLLLLDVVVLGLQMVLRAGHGRFVQPGLERFVAQGLGQRPVNAGHARVAGDFADSGYGDAEGCADLVGCSTSRRAAVSVCVVFCSWWPWVWASLFPVKKPGCVCRVRVTQNTPRVSAIDLKCCPPADWNCVRSHAGTLTGIRVESYPPRRGIRT